MKFSTREDIEAPVDHVFEVLTDFKSYERQAMRRGYEPERLHKPGTVGVGMKWQVSLPYRGRTREVTVEVVEYDQPNKLVVRSKMVGLVGLVDVEFVALSRQRTRVQVGLELLPRTMSARVLVQSLKLAKARLSKRFAKRVSVLARDISEQYQKTPSPLS